MDSTPNMLVRELVECGKNEQFEKFASKWKDRVDPALLRELYTTAISAFQSKKVGCAFERFVRKLLQDNGFEVHSQVPFKNGFVVADTKGADVVDLAIGPAPTVGVSVSEYIVLSCKTTMRERKKLDTWSTMTPPRMFYCLTTSDDYGDPVDFGESPIRKIVTCTPRTKDTRIYKLSFDDIVTELRTAML
jgi:hypothetical protein